MWFGTFYDQKQHYKGLLLCSNIVLERCIQKPYHVFQCLKEVGNANKTFSFGKLQEQVICNRAENIYVVADMIKEGVITDTNSMFRGIQFKR